MKEVQIMGKAQRDKGYRGEHNLVRLLQQHGIDAKRVPLSGATSFAKGDIIIDDLVAEVKVRKDGFKQIYKWIEGKDLLFIKADRKDYLVVMNVEMLIKLLEQYQMKRKRRG
jgi:Holliday junction resolvase